MLFCCTATTLLFTAEAMEIGAAAVLVNTAIATAGDPVMMLSDFMIKNLRVLRQMNFLTLLSSMPETA